MSNLTPAVVVAELTSIGKQLAVKADELAVLDASVVDARRVYEISYARVFLGSEGAMDVRRYEAVLQSANVKFEFEVAEQRLRAARESIRVLRDKLETLRSISAILKLEWSS